MANVKISALPAASAALTTQEIPVNENGTSKKVTVAQVLALAPVGYQSGSGGTVSQATSRTTGVTLNKPCGNITMFSAAQAAAAVVSFTLTNSFIAATDFLLIQHISGTNAGAWHFSVVCSNGSAVIYVKNISSASITSATPFRFSVIKGVTA